MVTSDFHTSSDYLEEKWPNSTYLCEYRGDVIFDKILHKGKKSTRKTMKCFIFKRTTSNGTFIAIYSTRKMKSIAW